MSGHPAAEELRGFVSGRIADARASEIAAHLESCGECVDRLEAIPDDDPLVCQLRACAAQAVDALPDLRGRRVGRYELLEELGRGGMGVVYRAFDPQLKRDVALKLILAGEHADSERRARLRQEAEAIAALQHPGIVQVYDVGEADGAMYLALELLHPGGLHQLTGDRPRSPRWIAALIRQIAETLHYAHAAGTVHRDLKPENLLLAPSQNPLRPWLDLDDAGAQPPPRIKIADFGLCKALDDDPRLTRVGMMLGTPDYMAPEQAPDNDDPVGPAADIFALGAILYELLAGEPPFHRDSVARQLRSLRDDDPQPPRRINPRAPKELEAICLKCLEKDPARRYLSAQELAEDLERFLNGEPVHARPMTLWRELVFWGRRKPIFVGHLIAAALLYLLHLVEMLALKSPGHQDEAHFKMTLIFISWVTAAALFEAVRERHGRRRLGEYLFALLPPILLQVEHWVDLGQVPIYINLFFLVIPSAMLIRPRVEMLALSTLATLLSFNGFVAIKHLTAAPALPMSHILLFNLVLLLALANYLLIRRLSNDA